MIGVRRCSSAGCAVAVSGCRGLQSAIEPSGPVAREIAALWWAMAGGAAVIFALVLALLLYALLRDPRRRRPIAEARFILYGGGLLPLVVLSVLLPFGIRLGTGASLDRLGIEPLTIHVRGHQFWWEIEYGDDPRERFTTANELYLPVGRPVELVLTSSDVIHSFWVPRLAGKLDLVPGMVNRLRLLADRPGAFRGQCAEYCGMAHAKMAFYVFAVQAEEFDAWAERQRQPASAPQSRAADEGAQAFQANGCGLCHAVRGHGAWGREGPDLTHFGGRRTLGAGLYANTPENVALWIAHNEALKPANRMPDFDDLDLETRRAIAAYLEELL